MSKPNSAKAAIKAGDYDLVVKTIADIGTQTLKKFDSDEEEEKKQILIVFEVTELSTKSKPVTLSKWITNSAGPKSNGAKLMKAAGLNPKTADWDDLLNKAVQAEVGVTDGGNNKIESFAAIKGRKAPRGFMETNSCYLDKTFSAEAFEAMPEFIQNQMLKAPEFDDFGKRPKAKKGEDKKPAKGKAKK